MEREKLGSRLGFILLSAGCAIGCGNVWKFPWMCGQYGGGGFVLLYFFLPGDFGPADHDYGVQRGPGGTGEPHQNVSKTGEKGPEMAYSWVCFILWKRGPDGVLHGGHRVDCVLFCAVSDGKYPGSGIFVHDYKPGG